MPARSGRGMAPMYVDAFLSFTGVSARTFLPSGKRTGISTRAKDSPSRPFKRFSTEVRCSSRNSNAVPLQLTFGAGSSPSVGAGVAGVPQFLTDFLLKDLR